MMSRFDRTTIFKVGDSWMVRIPASLFKEKDFPFKKDEKDLVMEIAKCNKSKGLFIRKVKEF